MNITNANVRKVLGGIVTTMGGTLKEWCSTIAKREKVQAILNDERAKLFKDGEDVLGWRDMRKATNDARKKLGLEYYAWGAAKTYWSKPTSGNDPDYWARLHTALDKLETKDKLKLFKELAEDLGYDVT